MLEEFNVTATRIAEMLRARGEKIAVADGATGGLISARRAEATFTANSEQQRLQEIEIAVSRDVRTAWLDAQASFRRLDLARQLQMHAADALDLAQTRYDNGLGSIVELTQAQLSKTQADIEAATARFDCQIRTATLRFQIGALK